MKKLSLNIIFWLIAIPLIVVLLSFVSRENRKKKCHGFRIEIDYQGQDFLFTADDIEYQVMSKFDSLNGVPLKQVKESDIEELIESNPYVLVAEVYTTIDGFCVAEVVQRKTIVQFIDLAGRSMYADEYGFLMPDDARLPARVPVASGNFSLDTLNPRIRDINIYETERTDLQNLFTIARMVNDDRLLRSAVEQIYLDENNRYELATKLGKHSVLLGDTAKLDDKFERLGIFYRTALDRGGWKNYNQLNLMFENQVVCNKK